MSRNASKKTKKLKSTRSSSKKRGRVLRSGKAKARPLKSPVRKRRATKKRIVSRSVPPRPSLSDRLPFFLIVLGLMLLAFWGSHKFFYYRSLSLSRAEVARVVKEEPTPAPLPTHIFIPWNTDADIEALAFVNDEWQVSETKVTYLLGSARPGEQGNIIMYGHNKREILGNIRVLTGGEKITITTKDGKEHVYVVKKATEVEPTELSLLDPTETETLTLYTCSGFWDSKRYIVTAEPLKDN